MSSFIYKKCIYFIPCSLIPACIGPDMFGALEICEIVFIVGAEWCFACLCIANDLPTYNKSGRSRFSNLPCCLEKASARRIPYLPEGLISWATWTLFIGLFHMAFFLLFCLPLTQKASLLSVASTPATPASLADVLDVLILLQWLVNITVGSIWMVKKSLFLLISCLNNRTVTYRSGNVLHQAVSASQSHIGE